LIPRTPLTLLNVAYLAINQKGEGRLSAVLFGKEVVELESGEVWRRRFEVVTEVVLVACGRREGGKSDNRWKNEKRKRREGRKGREENEKREKENGPLR
jgi:hypothetical protein